MKYLRILLFVFVSATLCVGLAHDQSTTEFQISSTQFEKLYNKILNNSLHVGGGTGTMIRWDDENKIGYVLTAYHVVAGRGMVQVSWTYWWEIGVHTVDGTVYAIDPDNDLALVTINEKHEIFEVMSDVEYYKLERGHPLLASGYPVGDTNGLIISPGVLFNANFDDDLNPFTSPVLYHGCTGWFGFSGGGIIDVITGELVGVEVRFGPGFHSSSSIAVPAPTINAFLKRAFSKS